MKQIIKEYIVDELLIDDDIEVNFDTSLFEGRLLKSIQLVSMLNFIEEKFNITIDFSEVNLQNLDNIDKIEKFISQKIINKA